MSVKSNSLNLYDAVTGNNHYYQRVSTDQVEVNADDLPMNLRAGQVNFYNSGGQSIIDVVTKIIATDAAIAAEVVARQNSIAIEEKNREDEDDAINILITSETQNRLNGDSTESKTRGDADTVLQNAINTEAGARAGAVTAEQTVRASADSTLQFNIDEEKTARLAADTFNSNRITIETNARVSAISTAVNDLTGQIAAVTAAVDNELIDRENAVMTVSNDLAAEIANRENAVSAEQLARSNADNSLSANINTERVERLAEVSVERERINAMLSGSDINLDQLSELVTAYQSSDSDILVQIGALTTSINGLQSSLMALTLRVDTLVIEP